eukprot:1161341-Pelagomonas_calceolata.AAC.15
MDEEALLAMGDSSWSGECVIRSDSHIKQRCCPFEQKVDEEALLVMGDSSWPGTAAGHLRSTAGRLGGTWFIGSLREAASDCQGAYPYQGFMHAKGLCAPGVHACQVVMHARGSCTPGGHAFQWIMHFRGSCMPGDHARQLVMHARGSCTPGDHARQLVMNAR